MGNSRDPPPPIRINHRSRIFKYTYKILDHTSKISLWRSNQKEIIGSCLILDLVHCSGSSFGRRRSRRRRHGEEALGQEEKAVERLSLYVEWRQRMGCITRTSQCEYEISSIIHEHHEQEGAQMGHIGYRSVERKTTSPLFEKIEPE